MMVMMMLKMIVIVIIIIFIYLFIYLFILFHWFIGIVIKQLQQRVYDTLTEKLGQPALTASFNSNDQTQQLEQMQQLNSSWSLDDVLDIILDST